MRVVRIPNGAFVENTYLVIDEAAAECAVIDPGEEAGRILHEIAGAGARPTAGWRRGTRFRSGSSGSPSGMRRGTPPGAFVSWARAWPSPVTCCSPARSAEPIFPAATSIH